MASETIPAPESNAFDQRTTGDNGLIRAAKKTRLQILVANENAEARVEISRLLQRTDGRPVLFSYVETGAAAIAELNKSIDSRIDVAILDFDLPDMTAVEVLEATTNEDGLPPCPILVLAANRADARAAFQAGAQDYLGQEYMREDCLMRAVENAMFRWEEMRDRSERTQFLQRIANITPGVLHVFDIEQRQPIFVNRSVKTLLGYQPDDILDLGANAIAELMHPDDVPRFHEHVQRVRELADDEATQFEFRMRRRDGAWRWFQSCDAVFKRNASGSPCQLIGTAADITERRESETQLKRTHDTFYNLIQNTPFGLYVVDSDFRLRQFSVGARKVFSGVPNALGRDFAEVLRMLWTEPFASEAISRFRHTLASGEPFTSRTVEARQDTGNDESYDWRIERVVLPDGRHGVVCHFYDLSERFRWEAALLAKERELQAIADNTPDILTRFDRNHRHLFVNAEVERSTGRSRQEFIGKTNRELEMPEHLCSLWDDAIQAVFATGATQAIDFASSGVNGLRQFTSRLVPEIDPSGEVTSVLGVTHDITEQRDNERALRASEERLARAQRAAWVGTWDWDVQTGLASWTNEAWALFTGGKPDGPVTFERWARCLHGDDRGRAVDVTTAALATGSRYEDEFRVVHADGTLLWLRALGEVVRENGVAVRLIGTIQNITRLKEDERALRDADRRKNEFLAILSHELRNPMAAISSAVQLLRSADLPPGRVLAVTAILERQTQHMNRLVEDLLDVSRISSGKLQLATVNVDLRDIVRDAVEANAPLLAGRGQQLTFSLPEHVVLVHGDPVRLTQVIGNLLNNAAKFSPDRGQIAIAVEAIGGEARLSVRDNGIGIELNNLQAIFEMFAQADTSIGRSQSGLGIGLSLVKRLCEMHGGTIEVASAGVGRGSEFCVRLPLAHGASILEAPAGATMVEPKAKSRRVLIVDDNADAAESLAMLLRMEGHDIRVAHDGQDAIDRAASELPHVIFLDIGLPKVDGYEACRQIRRMSQRPRPVIVALTGWGHDEDRARSKEAGFDEHFVKPVHAELLTNFVRRARLDSA